MITLDEARAQGIRRVCVPRWGGNAYFLLPESATGTILGFDSATAKQPRTFSAWAEKGEPMNGLLRDARAYVPYDGVRAPHDAGPVDEG